MGPTVVSEEELLGMFERLQDEHKRVLQTLLLTQVRLDKAASELAQANTRIAELECDSPTSARPDQVGPPPVAA